MNTWLDSASQDVKQAIRCLRAHPGVSVAAIAMLGLGIAITTAMFTVVDALILRPVPFREPDQLALVYMGDEHGGRNTVAPAVLRAWREGPAFAGAEAAVSAVGLIEVEGTVVSRHVARVTPGLFDLLGGVRPVRGRLFDRSEGEEGTNDRVLISEDVWRGLFRSDPSLIGGRITIDGDSLVVVGILPSDFRFPTWDTVIWRANALTRSTGPADRPIVYVRFASKMPREDALRVAMNAARAADSANAQLWPRVNPVAGMVLDRYYQRAVPLLAGGVILVFLVLCVNVSSLLLARLIARRREFSMRSALGASRGRLMRQSLVESSIIGVLGVVMGLGIAWMLVSLSRAYLPEAFLLRTLNPLNIDVRALVVTSASGVIATLAAGLLPAWLATRVNADDSLRVTDRRGTETRGARRLMRGLLVAEIALACMLLVGATLLVRSFVNLSNADRGLDARGVVTATISLPQSLVRDLEGRTALAESLREQIRGLPGVRQVAWSFGLPPRGGAISFGDWKSDAAGAVPINLVVESYQVGQDFFELYGIPLSRGRTFQPSDASTNHVIVGERLARTFWPDLDPLGRSFTWNKGTFQVIGVVKEIHHPSLDPALDRPEYYYPVRGIGSYAMMSIRCAVTCPDEAIIRQRLMKTHPGLTIHTVARLEDTYFEELARPRAAAALGFSFASIAILAAAGGLFSVLSYAVGRRKHEFGIRTALGASPAQIGRVVVGDALAVAAAGVAIGALGAWSIARALASLQYGVTMNDPVSWVFVLALLGVTSAIASWRPARDAMRVDPVMLLRDE